MRRSRQESPLVGGLSMVVKQKRVSMSFNCNLLKSPPMIRVADGKSVMILLIVCAKYSVTVVPFVFGGW